MNHSLNLVTARTSGVGTEKHFSVKEVAGIWGLSEKVVRRIFNDEPGVIVIGHTITTRSRREYKTIRIPESVLDRVHIQLASRRAA